MWSSSVYVLAAWPGGLTNPNKNSHSRCEKDLVLHSVDNIYVIFPPKTEQMITTRYLWISNVQPEDSRTIDFELGMLVHGVIKMVRSRELWTYHWLTLTLFVFITTRVNYLITLLVYMSLSSLGWFPDHQVGS